MSLREVGIHSLGLVTKLPNSRRYQLLPQGYSICLVFLKLFEPVYAPLTPPAIFLLCTPMSGSNSKNDRSSIASTSV